MKKVEVYTEKLNRLWTPTQLEKIKIPQSEFNKIEVAFELGEILLLFDQRYKADISFRRLVLITTKKSIRKSHLLSLLEMSIQAKSIRKYRPLSLDIQYTPEVQPRNTHNLKVKIEPGYNNTPGTSGTTLPTLKSEE